MEGERKARYRDRYTVYFDVLKALEKHPNVSGICRIANIDHYDAVRKISELGSFGMLELVDNGHPQRKRKVGEFRYTTTKLGKDYMEAFNSLNGMLKKKVEFKYEQK
jgi:predicted transcriptional regulator